MTGRFILILASAFIFMSCAHAVTKALDSCATDPELQSRKSAELQKLVKEDQADRSGGIDSIEWNKVNAQDLERRIAVARIFAEGCINSAADYAAAALIFQHGTTPDHYYQTFIWANQAVKLGAKSQRMLVANGIDRYLLMTGHKQLFGTQLSRDSGSAKFCIQTIEPTFPESLRKQYLDWGLKDQIAFVLKAVGATQSVGETADCKRNLGPSPSGTVPGLW